MGKIYQNDIGTKIILDTETDLSDASVVKIKVKKPSGTTLEWDASIEDASAGTISYIIASSDILDETGLWSFQAYVEFSNGAKLHGETAKLMVYQKWG